MGRPGVTATTTGTALPPAQREPREPRDPPAAEPEGLPDPTEVPAASTIGRLAAIGGVVVANTTLFTSLLLFFGRSQAHTYFGYFGVDATVLGQTNQDHLTLSVDALFVPIAVVAAGALIGLWAHTLLRDRIPTGWVQTVLVHAVTVAAVLLTAGGAASIVVPTPLSGITAGPPVSLAAGVLLLVYAGHLRATVGGRPRPALPAWTGLIRWTAVFALVGLSLLWAAWEYAGAVGTAKARQDIVTLDSEPEVVLYSDKSLSLRAPGVTEVRCREADARYRYRYDGLKLMLRSGDQYLFLPRDWSRADGAAILVPRSDAVRLEFTRAAVPAGTPATC